MSSLAARVRRPAGRPGARTIALPAPAPGPLIAVGIAAALTALSFGAEGGLRLPATTTAEIALTLGGAALCAAAIVAAPARRLWGAGALTAFGALAALTALSIVWAIQPSDAWVEAGRTLAYLAAFAGAVALVRLAPRHWEAVLAGLLLACAVLCAWALATKSLPTQLNSDETLARLREPFGYWNAIGLLAAMGVPLCLWLGARRHGHAALNALAYPLLGVLLVTILLAYSRGALLALGLGLAFWFAVVPLRLRAFTVLAVSAAVAAPVVAWVFGQDALTRDAVSSAARSNAGGVLGILVLVMVLVLLAAGLAIGFVTAQRAPGPALRRRAGAAILAVLVAAPLLGLGALAFTSRGVGGHVSDAWTSLTNPKARTPANVPGRLTAASSVRARYYREAGRIWQAHKFLGAGAGAFDTARARYRRDDLQVRHAHGYVAQTVSDLGLLGLAASLALLAAWLAAALRATGLRRRDRGAPFTPERVGLLTLATVVIVFGVHSAIDWTWFVPGTAVMALLAAGWVAGRGPLFAAPGEDEAAARGPATWRARAPRLGVAGAVVALALVVSWSTWQPLRSYNASNDALDDLALGHPAAAIDTTEVAAKRNPLSVEPLFDLAVIEDSLDRPRLAARAFVRAVALQPANPEPWRRLGDYQLNRLNDPKGALASLRAALFLDPRSTVAQTQFLQAYRELNAK